MCSLAGVTYSYIVNSLIDNNYLIDATIHLVNIHTTIHLV